MGEPKDAEVYCIMVRVLGSSRSLHGRSPRLVAHWGAQPKSLNQGGPSIVRILHNSKRTSAVSMYQISTLGGESVRCLHRRRHSLDHVGRTPAVLGYWGACSAADGVMHAALPLPVAVCRACAVPTRRSLVAWHVSFQILQFRQKFPSHA